MRKLVKKLLVGVAALAVAGLAYVVIVLVVSYNAEWILRTLPASTRIELGNHSVRAVCAGKRSLLASWAVPYLHIVEEEARPGDLSSYLEPDLPWLCYHRGAPFAPLVRTIIYEKGTPEEIRAWMEMSDTAHLDCERAVRGRAKATVARMAPVCRALGLPAPDYGRPCVGRTGRVTELHAPRGINLFITYWPPSGARAPSADDPEEDVADSILRRLNPGDDEFVRIEGRLEGVSNPDDYRIFVYSLRDSRWRRGSPIRWKDGVPVGEDGNWSHFPDPADLFAVYLAAPALEQTAVRRGPEGLPEVDGVGLLARLVLEGWGCMLNGAREPSRKENR